MEEKEQKKEIVLGNWKMPNYLEMLIINVVKEIGMILLSVTICMINI
jgi:hypothetical protein